MTAERPAYTPTRRSLLGAGAALLGGAGLSACSSSAAGTAPGGSSSPSAPASVDVHPALHGSRTLPFFGEHQSGILTPPQSYALFVAFDLVPGTTADSVRRLMVLWTDDAARLTGGRAPLADPEPELTLAPARLTATVGVGPKVVKLAGATAPPWLAPLPAFPKIDKLEPRWSDGDVLLHLGADDQVTLSHALRMMVKDAAPFARVRWVQRGFRRSVGAEAEDLTMRNLMGQVDGTQQPKESDYPSLLWAGASAPAWLRGGTSVVIRRIRFDLDAWDKLDRPAKEQVIGRTLDTGAPLTGTAERDPVDLEARTPGGLFVIPDFAHVRRAKTGDTRHQMLRRGYNYDDSLTGSTETGTGVVVGNGTETGLIFVAYQADVTAQFVPVQRRLAELDLLNMWTIPVGSAVFAMLPGVAEGEHLGQALLGR